VERSVGRKSVRGWLAATHFSWQVIPHTGRQADRQAGNRKEEWGKIDTAERKK